MPGSAREAVSLANEGLLAAPESITVKTIAGERFERVTGFRLKERPVMREPGENSVEIAKKNALDFQSNSQADVGLSEDDSCLDEIPF